MFSTYRLLAKTTTSENRFKWNLTGMREFTFMKGSRVVFEITLGRDNNGMRVVAPTHVGMKDIHRFSEKLYHAHRNGANFPGKDIPYLEITNRDITIYGRIGDVALNNDNELEILSPDRNFTARGNITITEEMRLPKTISSPKEICVIGEFIDMGECPLITPYLKVHGNVSLSPESMVDTLSVHDGGIRMQKLPGDLNGLTLQHATVRIPTPEQELHVRYALLDTVSTSTLDDEPTFARHIIADDYITLNDMSDRFMAATRITSPRVYVRQNGINTRYDNVENMTLSELQQGPGLYVSGYKPETIALR